jgi:MFS family permease
MAGSSTKQAGAPRWSALQRWTLGVTSMAAFMAGMDALVVTTALPTIHADLGAATSALSWTVAAYALGFAAVVLAGVALGDRYGRRRVFLTGLALFTLGSAGCALSPNIGLLIATRAIQGVGGGLAVPLSLVLISEAFPPQQRARAIGIWGSITGMAVAVAPLVGGAIVGPPWPSRPRPRRPCGP